MSQTLAMSLEIDPSNIVEGSRRRKKTRRLVDSVEWQQNYERLILDDVPQDELVAALIADVSEDPEIESEDEKCDDGDLSDNDTGFVVRSSEEESENDDDFITLSDEEEDEVTDDEAGSEECCELDHDTDEAED